MIEEEEEDRGEEIVGGREGEGEGEGGPMWAEFERVTEFRRENAFSMDSILSKIFLTAAFIWVSCEHTCSTEIRQYKR